MVLRILASIILLWSVLFMPFWLTVLLAIAGIIYFHLFFEALGAMLLSDLLFGTHEVKFSGIVFVSFVASIIFLIAAELIKKKLKFYS